MVDDQTQKQSYCCCQCTCRGCAVCKSIHLVSGFKAWLVVLSRLSPSQPEHSLGITTTSARAYVERTPRCAFSPSPLPDYPGYPWRCAYLLPVLLPDSLRADQPACRTAEARCRVSETCSIINLLHPPRVLSKKVLGTMKQRFVSSMFHFY